MAGEPATGSGEPAAASDSNQPSSLERTLKAQGLNRELKSNVPKHRIFEHRFLLVVHRFRLDKLGPNYMFLWICFANVDFATINKKH